MIYRINYSKVISQANSISANADELAAQIRMLDQIEQECRRCWKGQAADVFITKLHTLRNEMNRTRTQISNLSSTIKYCADKIQKEDREAAERAVALRNGH